MFRFLICDDDAIFCQKEEEFIKEYFSKQQIETDIHCFYSAEEIINLENKISAYDAIFLDVFFASPFCRKLQNKNVGCCKTVL